MDNMIYNELKNLNTKHMYKITDNPNSMRFHLHDSYEVMLFLSGNASYFIENNSYNLKYGDLIITNTSEIHAPIFKTSDTYERIIFHFSPQLVSYTSIPAFNLNKCFVDRHNGKKKQGSIK